MSEVVDASPTKQFFIEMITRDIDLQSCVLDLIDNCLDGATRTVAARKKTLGKVVAVEKYDGFVVQLTVNKTQFVIKDNCGGISIKAAKEVAFHLGKPAYADKENSAVIGAYGIGMKRAVFKLGKNIDIDSSTVDEGFTIKIDVPAWEKEAGWNSSLHRTNRGKTQESKSKSFL